MGKACAIGEFAAAAGIGRPILAASSARRAGFIGDELVAVALQDDARERASADDEHLLVVLLQFLHERQEVAVPADDDVGVDAGA